MVNRRALKVVSLFPSLETAVLLDYNT